MDRLVSAVGRWVEQVGLLNDGVVGHMSNSGMRSVGMSAVRVGAIGMSIGVRGIWMRAIGV